jgi:hypothetical protein
MHHYADKYVRTPEDIPAGEHWAIITGSSVLIPGDERSRTNPGHGYPESTESYIEYAAFTNESKFKEALRYALENAYGAKRIVGIHVLGTYSSKTVVEIQEPTHDR